jgi:hypothetical protein
MNSSDQRLLKAALGGMGAIAGMFAHSPAIALPMAFESVVISATSILLDTFGETTVEEKKPTDRIALTIPVGTGIKIEN